MVSASGHEARLRIVDSRGETCGRIYFIGKMRWGMEEAKRRGVAPRPFIIALLGLAAIALVPYCLVVLLMPAWKAVERPIKYPGHVLLVTAHPDDETVFFGPTITALRGFGNEVYLLCLTTGKQQSYARHSKLRKSLNRLTNLNIATSRFSPRAPGCKRLRSCLGILRPCVLFCICAQGLRPYYRNAGNARGLGQIRVKELEGAATALQVIPKKAASILFACLRRS